MFTTARAEKYRTPHPLGLPQRPGDLYGFFCLKLTATGPVIAIQASIATPGASDFNHVSVSLQHRTPTWEEMCKVKSIFWDEQDCVVQYHPPRSEYVNLAKNCLHLWEWVGGKFPRPSPDEIGFV